MSKTDTTQPDESPTTQNVDREPDELAQTLRSIAPDVLRYKDDVFSMTSPTQLAGHCYVLSEAYYHGVSDETRAKLTPKQMSIVVEHFLLDEPVTVSHWFLEHEDGTIIDLTIEQFETMNVDVDYTRATGRGFVPPSPSKRSRSLLDEVAAVR